jgi:hypothetical protein
MTMYSEWDPGLLGVVRTMFTDPFNHPINKPPWNHPRRAVGAFISEFTCSQTFVFQLLHLRTFHFCVRGHAFRLDSQHLAVTVSQARKITLTMPPKRLSQRLSRPIDEAPLAPSTQGLPCMDEDREAETFTTIEEVELQHATNVVGTSAGAANSGQNTEGTSLQSPQHLPSPVRVMQEHEESGQFQVEDWESKYEVTAEEELVRVHQ